MEYQAHIVGRGLCAPPNYIQTVDRVCRSYLAGAVFNRDNTPLTFVGAL